jgi:hypothetical protein
MPMTLPLTMVVLCRIACALTKRSPHPRQLVCFSDASRCLSVRISVSCRPRFLINIHRLAHDSKVICVEPVVYAKAAQRSTIALREVPRNFVGRPKHSIKAPCALTARNCSVPSKSIQDLSPSVQMVQASPHAQIKTDCQNLEAQN